MLVRCPLSIAFLLIGSVAFAQCGVINFSWQNDQASADTIFLQEGDTVTLYGVAPTTLTDTSEFQWFSGEGSQEIGDTVSFIYSQSGFFTGGVRIRTAANCTSSLQSIYILVSQKMSWSTVTWTDTICISEIATFQWNPINPDTVNTTCDSLFTEPLYLPDKGDGPSDTYLDTLLIDCYSADDTIQSASDFLSTCLNIEHSWMGDLSITLFAPSGDSVVLYPSSDFSSAHLGEPVDLTSAQDVPGTGYTYCFTETQPDFGTLASASSLSHSYTNNLGNTVSGSYMPAGSYLPEEPFSQLIGSSVNGPWVIQIIDHVGADNGWLFDWSINFDAASIGTLQQFVSGFQTQWYAPAGFNAQAYDSVSTFNPTDNGFFIFDLSVTDTVFHRTLDTSLTLFVDTFSSPMARSSTICFEDNFPWLVNEGSAVESQWYYPDTTTLWATGDSVAPPNLTAPDTVLIYLKTSSLRCESKWDTAVYIRYPALQLDAPDVSVFSGQSASLGATASGGSGNYSYSWVPTIPLTGANTQHPTTWILQNDLNVLVTATDNARGCSLSKIVQIEVTSPLTVDAGNNDTLCVGDNVSLSAQVDNGGQPVDSVRWAGPNGIYGQNPVTFSPTSSGWHVFTAYSDPFTDSDSLYIALAAPPDAGPDFTDTLCSYIAPSLTQVLDPSVSNQGNWWDSNGVLVDPTTSVGIGSYFYVVEGSPCPSDTAVYEFIFSGVSNLPVPDSITWCAMSGVQSTSWITLDTDTIPAGSYLFAEVFTNGPCTDTVWHHYEIKPRPQATWSTPSDTLCINSSMQVLTGLPAGGHISGPGVVGGQFDPATAGLGHHLITYTVTQDGCSDTDSIYFTVVSLPTAGFLNQPDTLCFGSAPVDLMPFPQNALLTGTGIVGSSFDPSLSGIGLHTVYASYTDSKGCSAQDSIKIEVVPEPIVSVTMNDSLCHPVGMMALSASPPGGQFYGTNVQGDSLSVSSSGSFDIGYRYTNSFGCSDSTFFTLHIGLEPQITFDALDSLCQDQDPRNLVAYPPGGQFVGMGTVGSSFDPGMAGVGVHWITYHYSTAYGCEDSASIQVTVLPTPLAQIQSIPDTLCASDPTYTLVSDATTTSYVDSFLSTVLDPGILNPGHHSLLTITQQAGCVDSASQVFWIEPQPILSLASPAPICINAGLQPLPVGTPAGGIYSGPGMSNGQFDPTIVGPGAHQIQYTFSNSFGCTDSISVVWTVHPVQTFTINDYPSSLCEGDPPVDLNIVQPTGGTLSGPGLSGGFFDPSIAGPGVHQITYTYINSLGCTSDTVLLLDVLPAPTVLFTGLPDFCLNDPSFTLLGGFPMGGNYSGLHVSNGTFNPIQTGTFTFEYTYVDTANGCMGRNWDTVVVHDLPAVPVISQTGHILSIPSGPYSYEWLLNGSSLSGFNTSSITAPSDGSYQVIVTDNNGCSSISQPFIFSTVGLAAQDSNPWKLYPNPSRDKVYIHGNKKAEQWVVHDVLGRTVLKGQNAVPQELDVSLWASGQYILMVKSSEEVFHMTFVVD